MNSSIEHTTMVTGSPRRIWLLFPLALCCFALTPAPKAFGVSPPPDGGYAGANTAEGQNALQSLTSGVWNTALGFQTLFHATTGNQNTATGYQALFSNTTGSLSVAYGSQALYNNTTGNSNVATGFRTLYANTTGSSNTGNGFEALNFNTTGGNNTANGFKALYINTIGSNNTANGALALYSNTTGHDNMATGYQALYNNTTGFFNMANGQQALLSNTTGYQNTANGAQALFDNTSGFNNTALGFQALAFNITGEINTAIGYNALFNTTGSGNIALGQAAGFNLTTGSNNIDIGNQGVIAETTTIRIGEALVQNRTFIAGIRDTTTGNADAIPVLIDSVGQLGTLSSSQRFKKEIKPMEQASEAILSLQPVTFQYKSDPAGRAQFGLIAEEVAKVNPDLVVRDAKGEIYSVRYEAVNAMLLNEFLKEHRTVQEQQKQIQALAAQLRDQAALLQKVSDRLELNKAAPQMVLNNQ
jgi:hypothetical protein